MIIQCPKCGAIAAGPNTSPVQIQCPKCDAVYVVTVIESDVG